MAVKKVEKRAHAPHQRAVQQTVRKKGQQNHEAPKNKKAAIIAQEIKFARLLANNDKRVRDKVIRNLKKWLTVRSKSSFAFTEADFMRLWKGLFYCMWMSDKPLIQEELAESLSKIVHCFDIKDVAVLYTKCALQTIAIEWFGIDQYRIDKFSMLVRRIIRQTFVLCKNNLWDTEWVEGISQILETLLLHPKTCLGFSMHLTELFLEELAKVSNGDLPENAVTLLVKPFAAHLTTMDDERRIKHIMKHIFRYLIFQSDVGIDYSEKFEAWKQAGFPTGHIDAMQKVEVSEEEDEDALEELEEDVLEEEADEDEEVDDEEDEEESQSQASQTEKPLDPRAGRVDVELPQLPFNPKEIAELLSQYKFHSTSTAKSRRQILHLIKELTELSEGSMPLGIKEIRLPNKKKGKTDTKKAAARLLHLEKELYSDNVHKKRKRKGNGQGIHEERDSDDSTNLTDDSETEELEEIETTQKEKKVPQKKNVGNAKQQDSAESSTVSTGPKKKKRKTEKKTLNDCETSRQSDNQKLKKSLSPTISPNNKSKKTKAKQNGVAIVSPAKNASPIKKKKAAKLKVCGSWDISDNVDPPTPTSTVKNDTSSVETTVNSVTSTPVKKGNVMLDKQTMWLVPIVRKLEEEKMRTPPSAKKQTLTPDSSAKKRVKIVLQRNTAQHTSEYIQQIRQSPAIPFDANRKPLAGVLKASPISSPINPFYKKNAK